MTTMLNRDKKGTAVTDDRGRLTTDLIAQYLDEVGRYELLTAAEETELAQAIEEGREAQARLDSGEKLTPAEKARLRRLVRKGERARERFVAANLRLVVANARRYAGSNLEMLDLIQEGNLGLIRAVDKFDWRKGFKFSTYATWWIRQAMTRGIADQARTIRIPVHLHDTIGQVKRTTRDLESELGRAPTLEEISEASGIPVKDVERAMAVVSTVALETPVGDDGTAQLGDFIPDPDSPDLEEMAIAADMAAVLEKHLSRIPEREAAILRMRYGLDGQGPRKLEEVGKAFDLTRERIRQLEKKALARLRHPSMGLRI
ncbi:MAG: RNA polymerase sigma factor [Acidimicrobiia bacterium]|jgi:RNA polymerase sigma factor (sigma-70 family)|nr:MAG: RNA polymerase sigma factor [Acidimicrobiia bacterium]